MPVSVPRLYHAHLFFVQTDLVEDSEQKCVYCNPHNGRVLRLKMLRFTPGVMSVECPGSGLLFLKFAPEIFCDLNGDHLTNFDRLPA